jgi:NADPH-dependent ferric siderophore reductase
MSTTAVRGRLFLDRLFVRSHVTEIEQVAARMRRIRVAGPALADLAWTPGQQVRVLVSEMFSFETVRHAFRDALRTYSVWDHHPVSASLELCVLEHGDGPGARWSRSLDVGDEVAFRQPEGNLVLHPADHHVFIGEETASVAFGAILRTVPASIPVFGALEIDSASDRLTLPRSGELSWAYRDGIPAESSAGLLAAARGLELPDQPGFLYLAGEAKTCAAIRRHFIDERGWPAKTSMIVKPFWTPGKRGLE